MSSERRRYSIDKSAAGGGVGSSSVAPIFEHFHTFKEFMQLQADTLEPGVAVGLYDQYKYDYKVFSSRKMFVQSQERLSGFVCDRYSPASLQQMCKRKIRLARAAAQYFLNNAAQFNADDASLDLSVNANAALASISLCQNPSGRVIGTIKEPASTSGSGSGGGSGGGGGGVVHGDSSLPIKGEDGVAAGGFVTTAQLRAMQLFSQTPDSLCTLVLKKLPSDVTLKMLEDLCSSVSAEGIDGGGSQYIAGFVGATLIPSCLTDEHRGPLMLQASKDIQDCTEQEQADIQHSLSECYIRAKGGALYPLLTGWLEFDTADHCAAAEILLDQKSIGDITTAKPQKLRIEKPRSINIVSSAPTERLNTELALAKKLIERLDQEFHVYDQNYVESPATTTPLKGDDDDIKEKEDDDAGEVTRHKSDQDDPMNDGKNSNNTSAPQNLFLQTLPVQLTTAKALDLCCLYLRTVHLTDFYCGRICWSIRELLETCGAATYRIVFGGEASVGDVEVITNSSLLMSPEDGIEFDKRVDELVGIPYDHILLDINESHPLFQTHWLEFAGLNTVRVDDEKFRCGICKKLFKGPDFVHKHIKNKHQEEIAALLKNVTYQLMNQVFEADDAKLLLFVANSTDYMRVFPKTNFYGPQRRAKSAGANRSTPLDRASPMFRDWDAPRNRLEEKSAGGNFRRAVRYDDL